MKFPPKRAPNPDTPAFQPKIEHKVVETQPFSFDQRDQAMIRQKEMKIQRVYEEEKKVGSVTRCSFLLKLLHKL